MQHNTFNDFPIGTSCCFPNSTFNDFIMTYLGIYCAREQKRKKVVTKIVLENKLFMDTLLLFLPLEKPKFVLKFSPQFPHNVNQYIQQYNVPDHKADTIHATML